MEAMVLAGGFGTRLHNIISAVPKPMAPIAGKPFLEYILSYVTRFYVTRIILCTGYKHEVIENFFGGSWNGVSIAYSVETEPLGTGGATKKGLEHILGESFFLLNGDTFFKIDLNLLAKEHEKANADVTIALKKMNNFDRYGRVRIDHNRIVKFEEKKQTAAGLINGGIYIVNKKIFSDKKLPLRFSFEKDILEKNVNYFFMNGYPCDNYFIDIGTPDDYARAQRELGGVI